MSILNRAAAQLKSPEFRSYLMSTHFWGPLANWGFVVRLFRRHSHAYSAHLSFTSALTSSNYRVNTQKY